MEMLVARYAAVMTTDGWDPFIESQFARTAARVTSGTMFVLANEAAGLVPVPPHLGAVAVDEAAVRQLRLPIQYERTLFCYNVDYLYYSFFLAHPDFDYYVFFDYPAVVDTDLDDLIAAAERDAVDFVAEPVSGPIADWVYAKSHWPLYPPGTLRGAALPLAILSKAALAFLLQRRLHLARALADGGFVWPFCEAFVPSELARGGFRSVPLSAYGCVESYAWWPPILDTALPARRRPGFIHPLLDQPRFIASSLEHARSRDLLSLRAHARVLRHVPLRAYLRPLVAQASTKLRRALVSRAGGGGTMTLQS